MRDILSYLYSNNKLTSQEAEQMLLDIAKGKFEDLEIASFLTVFNMRAVTIEELEGFRNALLKLTTKLDFSDINAIDLCGTGGDGKDTFNISTLSAFVVAGAGYPVLKHGNYASSSSCGSSNVMESLGYHFKSDEATLRKEIEECNITFLHAPLFNPAMKRLAPIRKKMGVRTFFNMLGPMINPSQPKNQVIGVFSLELGRMYNYLYQKGDKNFTILHSLDGYDEISLTGQFKLISNDEELILTPKDLGLESVRAEELSSGNSVEEATQIFLNVLKGNSTEVQKRAVAANAGMAIKTMNPTLTYKEATEKALCTIESGAAYNVFKKLLSLK